MADDDGWDPNLYQGRSRKQVENNNAAGVVVILVGFGGLAVYGIYMLLFALGVIDKDSWIVKLFT